MTQLVIHNVLVILEGGGVLTQDLWCLAGLENSRM